jgi:hypothetical protein
MNHTTIFPTNAQVLVPVHQLTDLFQNLIRQEVRAKQSEDLQEKLLSPKETCKLFNPAISLVTLDTWADKGLLIKYHIGGRTYYKYSEVIGALQSLKRYQRQPSYSTDK